MLAVVAGRQEPGSGPPGARKWALFFGDYLHIASPVLQVA